MSANNNNPITNDTNRRPGGAVLVGLAALRSRVIDGAGAAVSAPETATPRRATNAELLARTRNGKTEGEKNRAAEELRRRVKTLCAAALDRYTGHLTAQEADDLTQDVMVRLLCAGDENAPGEITPAYVQRVAVNLLIDKRRHLDRRGLNKPGISVDDSEAAIAVPDPRPTPAETAASKFQEYQLHAAIAKTLSPTEAKVVWLRVAGDLSHAEIAEELGIKEANARKHYERGLKRLRGQVEAGAFATVI